MSGFGAGFVIGLAVGIVVGRQQKPWSALTEKEKKIKMGLVIALAMAVLAGVVALLLAR